MNLQLLIVDTLRATPRWILRLFFGAPLEIDGNRLDMNMHALAKLSARKSNSAEGAPSVSDIRRTAAEFNELNLPTVAGVSTEDTTIELLGNSLKARIYRPASSVNPKPAILFFHQGGLVIMDHLTDNHFCSLLAARCGAVVFSLDYRLCPENTFPAPIEDARALWDHVQACSDKYNIDPSRVALAGDSAGGLISSTLALILRDEGKLQPRALCLAYPWVTTNNDDQPSLSSCANTFPLTADTMQFFNSQAFPNDHQIDHPWANPLKAQSLAGLPAIVIGTAGFDPIRDQGNAFAHRLAEAGNDVTHFCFESLTHSYLMFGRVSKEAERACETLAIALSERLNRPD
jgi:acetyl esterase